MSHQPDTCTLTAAVPSGNAGGKQQAAGDTCTQQPATGEEGLGATGMEIGTCTCPAATATEKDVQEPCVTTNLHENLATKPGPGANSQSPTDGDKTSSTDGPAHPRPHGAANDHAAVAAGSTDQPQQHAGAGQSGCCGPGSGMRAAGRGGRNGEAVVSPAAAAWQAGRLGVTLSGGGFLGPYLTGVLHALSHLGVITPGVTPVAGASAGALAAACFHLGMDLSAGGPAARAAREMAAAARSEPTGARHKLDSILATTLRSILPCNAVAELNGSGALGIAVTRLTPAPRVQVVSDFRSDADLVEALRASCYLPRFSSPSLTTTFRGSACVDGGILTFLPPLTPPMWAAATAAHAAATAASPAREAAFHPSAPVQRASGDMGSAAAKQNGCWVLRGAGSWGKQHTDTQTVSKKDEGGRCDVAPSETSLPNELHDMEPLPSASKGAFNQTASAVDWPPAPTSPRAPPPHYILHVSCFPLAHVAELPLLRKKEVLAEGFDICPGGAPPRALYRQVPTLHCTPRSSSNKPSSAAADGDTHTGGHTAVRGGRHMALLAGALRGLCVGPGVARTRSVTPPPPLSPPGSNGHDVQQHQQHNMGSNDGLNAGQRNGTEATAMEPGMLKVGRLMDVSTGTERPAAAGTSKVQEGPPAVAAAAAVSYGSDPLFPVRHPMNGVTIRLPSATPGAAHTVQLDADMHPGREQPPNITAAPASVSGSSSAVETAARMAGVAVAHLARVTAMLAACTAAPVAPASPVAPAGPHVERPRSSHDPSQNVTPPMPPSLSQSMVRASPMSPPPIACAQPLITCSPTAGRSPAPAAPDMVQLVPSGVCADLEQQRQQPSPPPADSGGHAHHAPRPPSLQQHVVRIQHIPHVRSPHGCHTSPRAQSLLEGLVRHAATLLCGGRPDVNTNGVAVDRSGGHGGTSSSGPGAAATAGPPAGGTSGSTSGGAAVRWPYSCRQMFELALHPGGDAFLEWLADRGRYDATIWAVREGLVDRKAAASALTEIVPRTAQRHARVATARGASAHSARNTTAGAGAQDLAPGHTPGDTSGQTPRHTLVTPAAGMGGSRAAPPNGHTGRGGTAVGIGSGADSGRTGVSGAHDYREAMGEAAAATVLAARSVSIEGGERQVPLHEARAASGPGSDLIDPLADGAGEMSDGESERDGRSWVWEDEMSEIPEGHDPNDPHPAFSRPRPQPGHISSGSSHTSRTTDRISSALSRSFKRSVGSFKLMGTLLFGGE